MVEETASGNTGHFGPQWINSFTPGLAMDRKPKGFPHHLLMTPRFLKTLSYLLIYPKLHPYMFSSDHSIYFFLELILCVGVLDGAEDSKVTEFSSRELGSLGGFCGCEEIRRRESLGRTCGIAAFPMTYKASLYSEQVSALSYFAQSKRHTHSFQH